MSVVLRVPGDVDLAVFQRVAWQREPVALTDEAVERMQGSRRAFETFVAASADRHLYGITTAHHRGAATLLSAEERVRYARRVPATPASFGPSLPERLVRGIVLARLAGFISGTTAVRPALAAAVAAMLDAPMPMVPARGRGEAGEIGTLRAVFGGLEDEVELEAKEGMALINGAPAAAAALADAALTGRARLPVAEEVMALAFDAAQAPEAHLDPALQDVWGDSHQAAALTRLRALTDTGDAPRSGHQAAVAFRDVPRMLGWLHRVQHWAEECATISLAAPGDNPIFAADGTAGLGARIISNAGYHDARAAPMLNALAAAWADLASLAAVQATRLAENPAGLGADERVPEVTLLSMTALGWAEEARLAAAPTLISLGGSPPSDTSSPALLAWRLAQDAGACLEATLATLAVLATHTIIAGRRRPPRALRPLADAVADSFPPGLAAGKYGPALETIAGDLQRRIHP
ncbi:MAG TPA: aromatic amino acid lyase [Solirubrobacteraceae bacterium]|nr:aromatic amino acid lyase [Solirubrobacteraceae bacterium]